LPLGVAELICVALHLNLPAASGFIILCATWGLFLYGVFLCLRRWLRNPFKS
jgi:hypothetical protein